MVDTTLLACAHAIAKFDKPGAPIPPLPKNAGEESIANFDKVRLIVLLLSTGFDSDPIVTI